MVITPEELQIHPPDKSLLKIINEKTFNDRLIFEAKSDFHDIKVMQNEIGRFLHYKDTYQAGIIDTTYYKGNLPYINYFLIPYLMNPKIKNILLIGFGSGVLVSQYKKLFKKLKKIDVVDIEENILETAKEFFGFEEFQEFEFNLQDGLVYLKNSKKKYDLIVVDVASNEGVDERFCDFEYLNLIKSHLKKDGIFVSNMPSSADVLNPRNAFLVELLGKYKQTFKNVSLYKGETSDRIYYKCFFDVDERVIDITNVILISSEATYPLSADTKEIKALGVEISAYLKDKLL